MPNLILEKNDQRRWKDQIDDKSKEKHTFLLTVSQTIDPADEWRETFSPLPVEFTGS